MAWTQYTDIFNKATGDEVGVTEHRNNALGIQAELEDRLVAASIPGVVSGLAGSISTTNIAIAAGEGYVGGQRCAGGVNVSFVGKSAATYYVYVDPVETVEASAYKAKTTVPTAAELLICSVAWDGSTTLSALVDLRQWGIIPQALRYDSMAAISAATVLRAIMDRAYCLRTPSLIVDTCGTAAGPSLVDIHAGAVGAAASIWSSAGSRFSIAQDAIDGALVAGVTPNQNYKGVAGDIVEVIVDAAATDAAGLHVVVPYSLV